jgi:hypothetical protein
MNFYEIQYCRFSLEFVDSIQVRLKSDYNKGHFMLQAFLCEYTA